MGEYSGAALDAVFFALSHGARRRLLQQLANAPELRVTELARRHRMSLNSVSKHVVVLEQARLVRRRVVGRDHFISADPGRLAAAERWLQHHREFWNGQLTSLARFFDRRKGDTT